MQLLQKSKAKELKEVPVGWKSISIKDVTIAHKQGFYTNKSYTNEGIKLVRITDLLNPKISYKTMPCLNLDKKTINDYKVSKGDFLIARSGAIGRFGIVKDDIPCVFGSYIIRFVFDSKNLHNDFFGHLFQTQTIKKQLGAIQHGSSNININAENIKSIKFLLPSLREQQKIASILSTVDELVQKTTQIICQTQRLKKGLMKRLLIKGIGHTKFRKTELGEIPLDWEIIKISEMAEVVMGQSPPGYSYNMNGVGIPLLNGPTEFGSIYPIPIQFTTKPTKRCKNGDILLCVRGSTTGRLNISNGEYCIGRGLATIRGMENKTNTEWLYYHFLRLQNFIFGIASGGGSTFPNINKDYIENIPLPYPSLSEQQKIASILSNIDLDINKELYRKSKIENLKKGLMQQLLIGKIRVKI